MDGDLFGFQTTATAFSRAFTMPNSETFTMRPVADFIRRWMPPNAKSIDPFARNKRLATFTNDLDPATAAEYHLEAEDFCRLILSQGHRVLLGLFDPPYSPRQISEMYKRVGLAVGMKETQSGALYKRVRDAMDKLIVPHGVCLSFGWNSNGMGKGRGYQMEEVLIVHHGGAHNDTICIAERKMHYAAPTDPTGEQSRADNAPNPASRDGMEAA